MSQGIISQGSDNDLDEKSPKRDTRSRRWMITLPGRLSESDPEVVDERRQWLHDEVEAAFEPYAGWMGQLEQGDETGYVHWQLYLEHKEPVKFSTLKGKFPQAHIEEARKDRVACVTYCSKEETRLVGPFWHGDIRLEDFAGKRNDLEVLRNLILIENMSAEEVLYSHPSAWRYGKYLEQLESVHLKRTVGRKFRVVVGEYYWGATGAGKTRGVFDEYGYESVYRVVEYGGGAFDSYSGEPILLLDEYRSQFPISRLLALLEGHPLRTGARYADKWAQWERVIVVSNDPLRQQYRAADGGTIITKESRAALARRFSTVREYTADGSYIEEFEGVRV